MNTFVALHAVVTSIHFLAIEFPTPCTLVCFLPTNMAQQLSSEEASALRYLLSKAKKAGSVEKFLGSDPPEDFDSRSVALGSEFSDDGGFECLSQGSMNDASKRRLTEEIEGNSGYGRTLKQQMPVPRTLKDQTSAASGNTAQISLPPDVSDLKDWGATVMSVGKYASKGWSYLELSKSADVEVKRYVKWLLKTISERNDPQFQDFVAYLKAAQYEESMPAGFVRQRK